MEPLVSAIILNYRTPKDAIASANALSRQTIAERMEIFIVDNHSDDESIGMLRAYSSLHPEIHIVETSENLGFGRGNGEGARLAKGKYLLFINPDNIVERDGVERMVEIIEKDRDVGIVGPALVYPDGSIRPSARRFPTVGDLLLKRLSSQTWHKRHATSIGRKDNEREVDWVVGACILISRQLFEELKGFDPRFFLFFEDTDLCRRCKERSKKIIYAPQIRVRDQKQRLSDGSIFAFFTKKTARIHLISAIKYFKKWGYSPLTKHPR